jgi:hypothetical protein
MQLIHQSLYGHAGGVHTARPVMALSGGHVYGLKDGRPDLSKPIFRVTGNHMYATSFHPDGRSPHALYEIRGDKVHTTAHHPSHDPDKHVFEIRGMMT